MYSNKNKITEPLRDKSVADTPDGTQWCLKALHPADHEIVPRGMPSEDAAPMVTMQYMRELLITPPEGLTSDTWDVDIWVLRDPVTFGCFQAAGSDGSGLTVSSILNDQLDGDSLRTKWVAMQNLCEQFRMSYAGVTGHLVAPAVANQGTVRAAQYAYPAYIRPIRSVTIQNTDVTGHEGDQGDSYVLADREAVTFPDPLITYGGLLQMPQAYQNEAAEGFYMPLKMTERDERYSSTNMRYALLGRQTDSSAFTQIYSTSNMTWPYYNNVANDYNATTGKYMPCLGSAPGEILGHIAFRGLSAAASVNLIFRYGLDLKVRPQTMYSPFQHEPPVYDQTAFKMYYEIARRMADAYPASYNAAGTLLTVVGKIAEQIWPLVVPHAQKLLNKLQDKIENAVRKHRDRTAPAQAANTGKKKPLPPRKTPAGAKLPKK